MQDDDDPWIGMGVSAVIEPQLQKMWQAWFVARMERHALTDDHPDLEIVRFAVDGAWLAFMCQTHHALLPNAAQLRARLLAQTQHR